MSIVTLADFSGSENFNVADHLLALNQSRYMCNITLDNTGSAAFRNGSEIFETIDTARDLQGFGVYVKPDGTQEVLVALNGVLYTTNGAGTTSISGTYFGTSSEVRFVNYLGRIYFVGDADGELLHYYESGAVTKVTGDIDGKYLAVAGGRLYVTSYDNPREVYYSAVFAHSFNTSTDKFTADRNITGIVAVGENAPLVVFEEDALYLVDGTTSDKQDGIGCVAPDSVKMIYGNVIWLSRNGLYIFSSSDPYPTKVSKVIENNYTHDAIFNQVTQANLSTAKAGVFDNKYYLSVGNLADTVKRQTLNDVVIVYDITSNTFTHYTYTANGVGLFFDAYVDNSTNKKYFLAGSKDGGVIYRIEVPSLYTDEDLDGDAQNYTSLYMTKHVLLDGGEKGMKGRHIAKRLKEIVLRLYSSGNVVVKYSLDGTKEYTTLATITENTTVFHDWKDHTLASPYHGDFKTISLAFEATSKFILYEINLDISSETNSAIRPI